VRAVAERLSVVALVAALSAACSSAPVSPTSRCDGGTPAPARTTIGFPYRPVEDQRIIHVLNRSAMARGRVILEA